MKTKLLLCLALVLSGNLINCHADETNAAPDKSEVVMGLGVNGQTNTSTVTIENTNSAKEFASAVATNYEKFILSATNAVPTNAVVALPMVAQIMKTNVNEMLTSPATVEVMAAEEFLKGLKIQGRLPGMLPDSHGTVTTGVLPESRFQNVSYPFSVTWHIVLLGDSFTNHYTVERPAAGANWQLKRAWRTDTEGQTIKEWQIK
jgi:hypothetical protein